MAFYIYDPKGYRLPYYPGEEWRSTKATVETRPSDEKSHHAMRSAHEQLSRAYDRRFLTLKKSKREEADVIASQIMNQPVITLTEDTPIQVAWNLFLERRFRHIPIVNSENVIIGILSDRRLLREFTPFNDTGNEKPTTVGEVMIRDILTAIPETPVKDIAKTFIHERVGCMPIVDKKGTVVGMITRSDILRMMIQIDFFELRT